MNIICLDLETTGLSPENDHVIEVAIARFDENGIVEEWSSLVKPPIKIPEFTTRLTGINDEMVKDAPTLAELEEEIIQRVGDAPIMGHFIFFDVNFLNHHGFHFENPQLDTCQLVQILLPNEPSYSLEVFTTKLGIVQEDAHRALDDVKANVDFFYALREHIAALSKEEKADIKPYLEKSDWPWAEIILDAMELSGKTRIEPTERTLQIQSERHTELPQLTTPFVHEEPTHTIQDLIDYAEKLEGKVLMVVPQLALVPEHSELSTLKDPTEYLDEKRLENFLNKERINSLESMLGLKCLLWLHHTETGEKSQLRIVKEEKQHWFDICCQESGEPQSFFAKSLNEAKKITAVSHHHFLKDRARKNPLLADYDHVVVMQTEAFTKTMEDAWHIMLSESRFLGNLRQVKEENPESAEIIDHIAGKVSILFGFLGMEIQRYGEPGDTRHTLIVEAHHRNTPQWNKVTQSASSIQAATAALGDDIAATPSRDEFERNIHYLHKILHTSGPILWMTSSSDGQVIVHSYPEESARLFHARVWPEESKLHLFCHRGNLGDDFKFLKAELAFPEETEFHAAEENHALPYLQPKSSIASPNDPQNIADVCQEMATQIPEVEGNIFLLITARHTGEKFFYGLPKHLPEDRKLFVQNMSGSLGKILKMSQETPDKNVFVGTESLLNFLLNEGMPLSLLAIHRLPFSRPNAPIPKSRSKLKSNAYKEYTLPMAKIRFHGILGQFLGNNWEGKQILGLDSRIERDDFI